MNAANATRVIYPAQNVLTLLSRAWNLFRSHFKVSILMMLPPLLLLTVAHLLTSLISSQTFLTPTSFQALSFQLLAALISVCMLVPYFFVWVLSSCALSRYYFSAIVSETPLSMKDCWRYIGKNWLSYLGITLGLGGISVGLTVANLILLGIGVFISFMILGGLSVLLPHGGNNFLPGVMVLMFLLIWGFTILTTVVSMMTFQGFSFSFPLLAFSTAPQTPTAVWPLIQKSFKLLIDQFPRLLLFAIAVFFLSMIMMAVMMGPAGFWVIVELSRLGVNQQHYLPLHVQIVLNLWSCLANLIMYPFHVSAVTLLWYDCLVRKEGLDLKLWLNQLIHRQGGDMLTEHAEVEPQPA